jgi:hypothetical protein
MASSYIDVKPENIDVDISWSDSYRKWTMIELDELYPMDYLFFSEDLPSPSHPDTKNPKYSLHK